MIITLHIRARLLSAAAGVRGMTSLRRPLDVESEATLRFCRIGLMLLSCWTIACFAHSDSQSHPAVSNKKTLGFVLADYVPPEGAEPTGSQSASAMCPNGFIHTNKENWYAQFPTPAERQRHLNRCGSIRNRGPHCEDVWFNPAVIKDPLPYPEPQGKIADGVNLDGMKDGRATQTTCAHEKFTSPDGEAGVDNQYYRYLGCSSPATVFSKELIRKTITQQPVLRLLLEITGVSDERNDNSVEVAMYWGNDSLLVDKAYRAVLWQSQRVDPDPLKVVFRQHGRPTDGMLITEPSDVMWNDLQGRVLIRAMSLRLKLTRTGAEGLRVGYIDASQLWQNEVRWATIFDRPASGPSAYAALNRLADGYKDPQSGKCTALSSAYRLEFVRAYVIHPSRETNP
jgi:hypothetical protein